MNAEKIEKILINYGADLDTILNRFVGDLDFYCECLEQFFADTSMEHLTQALLERDYGAAFEAAHALKGLSGNMGLTTLYNAACNIVEPLRKKDYSNLDAQFAALSAEYDKVKTLFNCE